MMNKNLITGVCDISILQQRRHLWMLHTKNKIRRLCLFVQFNI